MIFKGADPQGPAERAEPALTYGIPLEALLSLDCMEGSYTRPVAEIKSPKVLPARLRR